MKTQLSPGEIRFLAALRKAGPHGLTTAEVYEQAGCLRASARVWDLGKKGITVTVTAEGMVNGKMRYRYRLLSEGEAATERAKVVAQYRELSSALIRAEIKPTPRTAQAEMFGRTPWNPVAVNKS